MTGPGSGFFDDLSMSPATLQRARDAAAKLVDAMQPGDRLAVIVESRSERVDRTPSKQDSTSCENSEGIS
jgi:hypothetical protein